MASTARARRVLKRHVFERINVGFSLRQHARDLGAHLSTCARAIGKTLTQRIKNGVGIAVSIQGLPALRAAKLRLIKGKLLPASLYGAATTPVSAAAVDKLAAATAKAVDRAMPINAAREVVFTLSLIHISEPTRLALI
eukprot:6936009-Alexandrium_andersonii.AAC.1